MKNIFLVALFAVFSVLGAQAQDKGLVLHDPDCDLELFPSNLGTPGTGWSFSHDVISWEGYDLNMSGPYIIDVAWFQINPIRTLTWRRYYKSDITGLVGKYKEIEPKTINWYIQPYNNGFPIRKITDVTFGPMKSIDGIGGLQ
jgi:hypothetical protein